MVPVGAVDTLVVAILTTLTEDNIITLNASGTPVVRYYGVPYDENTHLSLGATIYKLPLTADDCGETSEEGFIYSTTYNVPINLNNITGKIINVAYTFKRGYTVPMNDSIANHSRFFGWLVQDPRNYYFPVNGSTYITPEDDIFYNTNQGAYITKYNLNQTNPGS